MFTEPSPRERFKQLGEQLTDQPLTLTAHDAKLLWQATDHLVELADNSDDLCVCDAGDPSVGMPATTCEVHSLAYLVIDIFQQQATRATTNTNQEEAITK